MSHTNNIVLRVQGPEGVIRITMTDIDTFQSIFSKIQNSYPNIPNTFQIWCDPQNKIELFLESTHPQFKNGDIIYISYDIPKAKTMKEDDIDEIIEKIPGILYRQKSTECNHDIESKCLKCSSIEIFSDDYIKSINPPLKHLPFHVYIRRKLVQSKNRLVLDDIRCTITPGCSSHSPWPSGICTKCQPSTMALCRQEFRNIDNIMFENHQEVDNFISYWRKSFCQRVGFLYGVYEPLDNIPLGIRARVHAIYEPPQINSFDSVILNEDPFEEDFNKSAVAMGYQKIGWILTDLLVDPIVKGQVKYVRDPSCFVLSAQECITAAHYQNLYPNLCKFSTNGTYGSKFVTVVVTSNAQNVIDFYGWQVSLQCMALVRNNCLVPTIDEPSFAYLRDKTPNVFIPDVYYKAADEYGNDCVKIARPVPVDYFLVEVPTGFPIGSTEFTNSTLFPLANRENVGEFQRFNGLEDFIQNPIKYLTNLHVISFIVSKLKETPKQFLLHVCDIMRTKNMTALSETLEDPEFGYIINFIKSNYESKTLSSAPQHSSKDVINHETTNDHNVSNTVNEVSGWNCTFCTFINARNHRDSEGFICCEMCGIPHNP